MPKKILNEGIVDVFLLYSFLKKITTPFKEWNAYKLGIIDENGNTLRKRSTLTRQEERNSFTIMDIFVRNIKRIIEKFPGGKSRLSSYLAGLYLIREEKNAAIYQDEDIAYESFLDFYEEAICDKNLTESYMKTFREFEKRNLLIEGVNKNVTPVNSEMAKEIGNVLGVDWKEVDLEQFRMGLEVEQEHVVDPETRVTKSMLDVGKIALAHLKEVPNYYTKLKSVEEDAPANSVAGGGVAGMHEPIVRKTPNQLKRKKILGFKEVLEFSEE